MILEDIFAKVAIQRGITEVEVIATRFARELESKLPDGEAKNDVLEALDALFTALDKAYQESLAPKPDTDDSESQPDQPTPDSPVDSEPVPVTPVDPTPLPDQQQVDTPTESVVDTPVSDGSAASVPAPPVTGDVVNTTPDAVPPGQ